jgi:hypothetical protein
VKIQFGLLKESSAWEQLCAQEGIPLDVVELGNQRLIDDYSVLVVNRSLDSEERTGISHYLNDGGAVIGFAPFLSELTSSPSRKERLEYLVADQQSGLFDIALLDAVVEGQIPGEANLLRTQQNTFGMFAGELLGGAAVLLPFDPADLLTDVRAANKRFYFSRDRLPAERVSLVAKGELRHLLHRCFEFLHHVRNIPYVHLWYYPGGKKSLFAFRVDTDGGEQWEIDALYDVAKEGGVGFSWFLDVRAHENWLSHFLYMAGQETGVHCYDHQVFPTYEANLKNITRARRLMEGAGLAATGFAAPFGTWNIGLAEAIDEMGFAYSSEFSFAYDSLPLYPETLGIVYHTLQIPVHPVSIGNLRRVGYTEKQMQDYYAAVMDRKLSRGEPLFFYTHPSHHGWETVRFLLRHARAKGIESATLGEFARWWKRRSLSKCVVEAGTSYATVTVHPGGTAGDDFWLRVSRAPGLEAIVPVSDTLDFGRVPWTPMSLTGYLPDIRRIREFDPRSLVGEIFTEMMRKFK